MDVDAGRLYRGKAAEALRKALQGAPGVRVVDSPDARRAQLEGALADAVADDLVRVADFDDGERVLVKAESFDVVRVDARKQRVRLARVSGRPDAALPFEYGERVQVKRGWFEIVKLDRRRQAVLLKPIPRPANPDAAKSPIGG